MTEDNSLDVVGVGKVAEAIPDESWNRIVDTACNTFNDLLAPLTATTGGLGRLIAAKFDGFVDAQKLIATQITKNAFEKYDKASSNQNELNEASPTSVSIIFKIIESSSTESNETLQELWSNLLANELVCGGTHPEFIHILSRLNYVDAYRLIELAQRSDPPKKVSTLKIFRLEMKFKDTLIEQTDFTNIHLSNLGLIERPMVKVINRDAKEPASYWSLTIYGKAFISAVSDPIIKNAKDVNI